MWNILSREDIEIVDDGDAAEQTPERLPISKLGKSKSEEVHVDTPGDKATTGERLTLLLAHSLRLLMWIFLNTPIQL